MDDQEFREFLGLLQQVLINSNSQDKRVWEQGPDGVLSVKALSAGQNKELPVMTRILRKQSLRGFSLKIYLRFLCQHWRISALSAVISRMYGSPNAV